MEEERFKSEMMRLMGTVINKLDRLESDVSGLKSDVSGLKSDVSGLKSDVSELKSDVSGLKSNVSELKSDVSELKSDVSELKFDVSEIKSVQKEHSQILHRLEAKTDNIATKVLEHEIRITKAEQNIEDLRGGIH